MGNNDQPPSKQIVQFPLLDKSSQTDDPVATISGASKTSSVATATTPSTSDATRIEQLRRRYEREMDELRQEHERNMEALQRDKEKLERYAKKVKAMYRKAVEAPLAEVDELLVAEQKRYESLEQVVRQLEENNQVLANDLQLHDRHDKKLKEAARKEASKVKELKRQLRQGGGKPE